jgi:hypothetical protein
MYLKDLHSYSTQSASYSSQAGTPSEESQSEVLVWLWVKLGGEVPHVFDCPLTGL